jgi:acetoacetate decarboxylase
VLVVQRVLGAKRTNLHEKYDYPVCELVEYRLEDVVLKGAWEGPAALQLFEHALAPVAALPVRQVLGGLHLNTDLTLGLGRVVHDYLGR